MGGRLAQVRAALDAQLRLWRLLGSAPRGLVTSLVLLTVAAGVVPVAMVLASGVLSERVSRAVTSGSSGSGLGAVSGAFVVVMALFLAMELLVPLQERVRWLTTKHIDGRLRERAIDAALAGGGLERLHGPGHQEAMDEVSGLFRWSASPGAGAVGLLGVGREYLTGLGAALVLARLQPGLAVLTLAVAVVMRVRWRRAVLDIVEAWRLNLRDMREASYLVDLGLGQASAAEVRVFGLRDWLVPRIRDAGIRFWTPTWQARFRGMGVTTAVHTALPGSAMVVVLVWAARATASGDLGIGDLVVTVAALGMVLGAGSSFRDDMAVEYAARSLPGIELLERDAAAVTHTGDRTVDPGRPPQVELRDLGFCYPGGENVLGEVALHLAAGTSTALVGLNGAGKSTLVRLLCGLYTPTTGRVLVDGVDLRELDLTAWRRTCAVMFQGFLRLPLTAVENVAVGYVEAAGDTETTERALREAHASSFANRLPADDEGEGVPGLSGGQWQRLALARTMVALRHGARFLVLDEPTANLDTSSEERLVRDLVDGTRGEVTSVLVTHRLALARRCDRIVVLENGRVLEQGSHQELVDLQGRYARTFASQAALYPREATG